jgi:sterol desaturase/sphingolipid hydroxylase (fatty acid hydroxylase superfamily)
MLTKEENGFIAYWEENRSRKRKVWRQLSVGLPLGVALAGAILVNLYSGWNPAGSFVANSGPLFLVILVGIILVVLFVVIFSARHRWDMNEQHYRELLAKRDRS